MVRDDRLPIILDFLYDAEGVHVGGLYPPVMVNGVLTEAHAEFLATRNAFQLVSWDGRPQRQLSFVLMLPEDLHVSDDAIAMIVFAIDKGHSVMLHATDTASLYEFMGRLHKLIGGWHA